MSEPMFDLFSPEFRRDPYPFYAELRHRAPAHRFERPALWAVGRYRDVCAILKKPEVFSSSLMAPFDATLLGVDPPAHTRFRRIVSGLFSPPRTVALEQHVREIARRLIQAFIARGQCELIAEFASPLSLSVIAEMLGADAGRWVDFKRWSSAALARATGTLVPVQRRETDLGLREFATFLGELVEGARSHGMASVLRELLEGTSENERLTPAEAVSFARLLLIAGNETTTNLVGNAVWALLEHPEQMEAVRADRNLVAPLVEETLRYESPVQIVHRVVTRDTEISGIPLPSGARVMALLGSANRDPEQFPEPDRFRIDRNSRDHIAFGFGTHYCLGAHLARLEARIALDCLLSELEGLRTAEPLDRLVLVDSVEVRGPRTLGLTFAPRPSLASA